MATAAGLSYPSWTRRCILREWRTVGRWRNTVLLLTFACAGFYKNSHELVQMATLLETRQDNTQH